MLLCQHSLLTYQENELRHWRKRRVVKNWTNRPTIYKHMKPQIKLSAKKLIYIINDKRRVESGSMDF